MARPSHPQRAWAEEQLAKGIDAATIGAAIDVPARTVQRWGAAMRGGPPKPKPAAPKPAPVPFRPPALRVVEPDERPEPMPHDDAPTVEVIPARAEEMVEELLGQGAWTPGKVRSLARALRVEVRELEQIHAGIIRRTADALSAPPAERAADLLLRVRHAALAAHKVGDLSARNRSLSLEARIQGMERLAVDMHTAPEEDRALTPDELRERRTALLARVERLRSGSG